MIPPRTELPSSPQAMKRTSQNLEEIALSAGLGNQPATPSLPRLPIVVAHPLSRSLTSVTSPSVLALPQSPVPTRAHQIRNDLRPLLEDCTSLLPPSSFPRVRKFGKLSLPCSTRSSPKLNVISYSLLPDTDSSLQPSLPLFAFQYPTLKL